MNRQIVAGQELFDALMLQRSANVAASAFQPGCFESESLCDWQRDVARRGIVGVELVRSIYGWSVRYDSGLQGFALVASCRAGQVDGTIEDALRAARVWVAEDAARRYAWIRSDVLVAEGDAGMNATKQTITEVGYIEPRGIAVNIANVTPHWKVYDRSGTARAEFVVGGMEGNRWLSIDTVECGEKSSKRTMVTLNESSARALYEYLAARFAEKVPA